MSRLFRRADRIREDVSILQVLYDFGYRVRPDDEGRRQQFPCNLHGDGRDGKASARAYPGSNSFHCWACGRTRDVIALVRETKNIGFAEAVTYIEKTYHLPTLPWEAGTDGKTETRQVLSPVEEELNPHETVDSVLTRSGKLVRNAYLEKALPPERCAALWEDIDKLTFLSVNGMVERGKILTAGRTFLLRVKEELFGPVGASDQE